MTEEVRYNRQVLWFGAEGQSIIENVKIAIIGIGGTGSHIVQQLAYLGVQDFTLIDSDKVSETNLNRLVSANNEDVGKLKVDIGKRLINFINKKTRVTTVPDTFISELGIAALKETDFIFGCVDKDGARLLLTEFCKAYNKPFLDIATDIDEDAWGGRIVFTDNQTGCLVCRDQLSQEEIHRDLSSPEDRSVDDKIYGVPKEKMMSTGPAVISLNGVLASLAVTEFLVHMSNLRPIRRHLVYRGKMGIVVIPNEDLQEDCYYCKSIIGIKDEVDMYKYVRQGINKILR